MSDQPAWSGATDIGVGDGEITTDRQDFLACLPADMVKLQERFGSDAAQELCRWGERVKAIKYDRHACEYVKVGRR